MRRQARYHPDRRGNVIGTIKVHGQIYGWSYGTTHGFEAFQVAGRVGPEFNFQMPVSLLDKRRSRFRHFSRASETEHSKYRNHIAAAAAQQRRERNVEGLSHQIIKS